MIFLDDDYVTYFPQLENLSRSHQMRWGEIYPVKTNFVSGIDAENFLGVERFILSDSN